MFVCVSCLQRVRLICKLSNRDARTEIKSSSQGLVLLCWGKWILFDVVYESERMMVVGRERRMNVSCSWNTQRGRNEWKERREDSLHLNERRKSERKREGGCEVHHIKGRTTDDM